MLVLDHAAVNTLIQRVGLHDFYLRLAAYLIEDFSHWAHFQKSPRHAVYVPNGVLELMPICDEQWYSFKYVNGHPTNPQQNKLNVVALGMLADVASGYPVLLAAMTLLTAVRTATVSALSSQYLAKKNAKRLAIIGCGAQSEFQVLAHQALLNITHVHYFDRDLQAMQRFADNLADESFQLMPADSVQQAVDGADIIITATAAPGKQQVLRASDLKPGQHICAIGGDSPGKTELDPAILTMAKVVVEYFPQTCHEGEIQNLAEDAKRGVYAELWEVFSGLKTPRLSDQDITVFDGVGFALEDFSALRLLYQLAQELRVGTDMHLIPDAQTDCKNLYGLLKR